MASGVVAQSVFKEDNFEFETMDELNIPSFPPQLVRQKAVWLIEEKSDEKSEEVNFDDPMRKQESFIETSKCLIDIRNYMSLPELIRPSMEMIYEELVMTGMLKV